MIGNDDLDLAERVREACVRAALDGYQDAAMAGLCDDGAQEAAISAIRRLDLRAVLGAAGREDEGAAE